MEFGTETEARHPGTQRAARTGRRRMKLPTQKHLWWITVAVFLCMTLWPIWSARFPPMQDYPGQLFYAEVLRAHNDPASDYDRYYEFRFHPVYATFYLTTLAFARFVPIELAGKLSLSLYPVLIALVVLRLGRRVGTSFVPWGALLFFPFAFNQQYFYGNITYILSLPILMLALLDFEDFLSGAMRAGPVVRHALWQVALVITHPLSFLVFLAMAVIGAIVTRRRTNNAWGKLAATIGTALLVLVAVWLAERGTRLSDVSGLSGVVWLPPAVTLGFFGLMFDGMQPLRDADPETLLLWGGVLAVLLAACVTAWRTRVPSSFPSRYSIFLGLSILGMFALPFQIGDFSYLNVRLAALVYFLVALCAAQMQFNKWLACCMVGLLALCLVDSIAKQARISAETNDILPVIRSIPPHSRILPLVFDPGSPELDKFWFAPHVQEFNYYHLLVGGGFNPYLFGSPVDPVRPKPGEERPAPSVGRPDEFTWELHAADYPYFLVQGAPGGLPQYLGLHCNKISASGKWMLFARKPE